MEQYISKPALIAEIDKRIITYKNVSGEDRRTDALISLKNSLDTLEVKEVDLDKEIDNFWDKNYRKVDCGVKDIKLIGEHFFELGLKVQKGEDV